MVNINNYNKQTIDNEQKIKELLELQKAASNPLAYKDKKAKETKSTEVYKILEANEIGHSDTAIHMSFKNTSEYDINSGFKRKMPLDKFDEAVISQLETMVGKEIQYLQSRVSTHYKNDNYPQFNYIAIFKNDNGQKGFEELGKSFSKAKFINELPQVDKKYNAVDVYLCPEEHTRTEYRDEETKKKRKDYNYVMFAVRFKNNYHETHKKNKAVDELKKQKNNIEKKLKKLQG